MDREVLYTWRALMERTMPLEQPSPWNGRDHYHACIALEVLPKRSAYDLSVYACPFLGELAEEQSSIAEQLFREPETQRPGFPLETLTTVPLRGAGPTAGPSIFDPPFHAQSVSGNVPAPAVKPAGLSHVNRISSLMRRSLPAGSIAGVAVLVTLPHRAITRLLAVTRGLVRAKWIAPGQPFHGRGR